MMRPAIDSLENGSTSLKETGSTLEKPNPGVQERYVEMLDDFFVPELQNFPGYNQRIWFRQDRQLHTSNSRQNYVCTHIVLRLPPYHPDFNPIENIWAQIKGPPLSSRSSNSKSEYANHFSEPCLALEIRILGRSFLATVISKQDLKTCTLEADNGHDGFLNKSIELADLTTNEEHLIDLAANGMFKMEFRLQCRRNLEEKIQEYPRAGKENLNY
ncbi:hypothetical protein EVAR_92010_1 [Eumeta japonica]|uniref:Tc1-like transposase DDE domain-containing protein n=1 Tax=Eumeta variegata TaxID=151549 RepID=A0A4C1ZY02_EUMVA|nr:hypothetical protein EVAR_92010_1 [Eumeta japonica]